MRWAVHRWFGLLILCIVPAGPVQAQMRPDGAGIYSCEDASGRRITSDRPIAACMDREQRVLGASGVEKARIGPRLSDQEKLEVEERERRLVREKAQSQEQARRDRALLQRYPRQELHLAARATALEQVDELLQLSRQRIDTLRGERRSQEQELEFYRRDPSKAPATLQRNLTEIDAAIAQQTRYAQTQQEERNRIQQRFDAELQLLQRMWTATPSGSATTSR